MASSPARDFIPRLYIVHMLLIPGILLALITAHLMLVWYQKHTQYPGPGRTNNNVVGYPLFPVYMAKAGGFFFVVFGVTALHRRARHDQPDLDVRALRPDQVTAGSQPDWYIGWLDGALRVIPNWETTLFGYTISWNVFIPALVVPGHHVHPARLYPFIEAWVTGDKREHHLLDRPRNAPTRTALGAMAISFYGILWISGGNDIIAMPFDLSINPITWFSRSRAVRRAALVFVVTRRICLAPAAPGPREAAARAARPA